MVTPEQGSMLHITISDPLKVQCVMLIFFPKSISAFIRYYWCIITSSYNQKHFCKLSLDLFIHATGMLAGQQHDSPPP